jgi:hypothetical protein
MKINTFYLPIKSINLAHYFVKGCICPSYYIQNRNEDLQNTFNTFILLSSAKFTDKTNCSLEVILNSEEVPNQVSDYFYLLDSVLPISRIRRIYFDSEEQKVSTIFNVTSGAAFLPINLIKVELPMNPVNSFEIEQIEIYISKNDWSAKLDLFNRILGGFATMKIAKSETENYSENYFDTLASINKFISNELESQSIKVSSKYEWAVIKNDQFSRIRELTFSNINDSILINQAKNDSIEIVRKNGIPNIDLIDKSKLTYLIAILASYGVGKRKSIDNFLSDLSSNKFESKRIEGIALMFGINNGYEIFRNEYRTSNFHAVVKFKLDSLIDYYTIESVFQYVFNDKISITKFDYLDNWVQPFKGNISQSTFETFRILDKVIFTKKKDKKELSDSFQILFHNTSRDKIYETIIYEINKFIPSYISDKKEQAALTYFKNILEKELESYSKIVFNSVSDNLKMEHESKLLELNTIIQSKSKEIETLKLRSETNKPIEIEKTKGIGEIKGVQLQVEAELSTIGEKPVEIIKQTKPKKNPKTKSTRVDNSPNISPSMFLPND